MEKAKAEILRFLGCRGQEAGPELDALIDACRPLMLQAASPRHVEAVFDLMPHPEGLRLEGTELILRGGDIARHLAGCGQTVLLAATLGAAADSLIRRWEQADLTRSLVLDACAAQLIEQYCDETERRICREAAGRGLAATPRFSPGYGDLPLDIQPKLLAVLDAGRKIGLTCTENFILIPQKSVTALIGLGKNPKTTSAGCGLCRLNQTCNFRKG
jgi:hypothetical protein